MKRNRHDAKLMITTLLAMLGGCLSFVSSYQGFVRWVDSEVALRKTIEQLGFDPAYPFGAYLADEHYLTNTTTDKDGWLIYHYARPTLKIDMICHYHLIVDSKTRIVVGWDFDREFGDPKKTCGVAG